MHTTGCVTGVVGKTRVIGVMILELQCHDIGPDVAGILVGQGIVVLRQQTTIEMVNDRTQPSVLGVMKDSRCHSSPIVDQH